uniref:Myosin motor domain-containing protein n=1 Tax=Nelumbo nucifera TaxID=4432 RepID=A0A822XN32_NELNU|nr:TPA_asm: hypothetical protein HUJ06_023130 [Nelumbo nucifera]
MEQEEYTKEEINWSYIEFVDNQDVLDLIEKDLAPSTDEVTHQTKPRVLGIMKLLFSIQMVVFG